MKNKINKDFLKPIYNYDIYWRAQKTFNEIAFEISEEEQDIWEAFTFYSYCFVNKLGGGVYADAESFLDENPDFLNKKPSIRMIEVINLCLTNGEKYYADHAAEFIDKMDDNAEDIYHNVELRMEKVIQTINSSIFDSLCNEGTNLISKDNLITKFQPQEIEDYIKKVEKEENEKRINEEWENLINPENIKTPQKSGCLLLFVFFIALSSIIS
ncbi:MAG: hypothetical protein P8K70_03270 [Flavobacteriaceae bacterium]|nr:hypothetical protein [Flavobacteriaceae bacterium]